MLEESVKKLPDLFHESQIFVVSQKIKKGNVLQLKYFLGRVSPRKQIGKRSCGGEGNSVRSGIYDLGGYGDGWKDNI